jgi:hypothetical protein
LLRVSRGEREGGEQGDEDQTAVPRQLGNVDHESASYKQIGKECTGAFGGGSIISPFCVEKDEHTVT